MADNVTVGPFCHVGSQVRLGSGTELKGHCTVTGRTNLGSGNVVWPHAVLGGDPQDLKFTGEDSALQIGDGNEFRECVTVHKGTDNDRGVTTIGSHNLIMAYGHIAHDCVIGDHVVMANAVQLAGHVLVEDHAILGGATAVHHLVTIGTCAFIGGMTRIVQDIPPYMVAEGNPARLRGINSVGVRRRNLPPESVERLKDCYRRLFHRGASQYGLFEQALDALDAEYPDDPHVQKVLTAARHTAVGVYGRYRESQRKDNRYTNPVR